MMQKSVYVQLSLKSDRFEPLNFMSKVLHIGYSVAMVLCTCFCGSYIEFIADCSSSCISSSHCHIVPADTK